METDFVQDHNRRAWDARVHRQQRFTSPQGDREFAESLRQWDARGWLGDLNGRRLLCLAAGGGRHGPLYAAAGAVVTVVDISDEQLRLDREIAAARGLEITTVQASMDRLPMFADEDFDVVMHPVSTCYLPDVLAVYAEVARITRVGGLYLSQHKSPVSLQADVEPSSRGYELIEPYDRQGPLPPCSGSLHREEGTMEFLHRWEDLIGGMCRAGFVIEDLREPRHADTAAAAGTFAHRSRYVAPYVRVRARRVAQNHLPQRTERIWTP